MAETLLKETDGLQLSVQTINDLKYLGSTLVRFADVCITQCCILRSEEKRIPAIRDKGITNPNAVFSKESFDAMQDIAGFAVSVELALGRFDMRLGLSSQEIAKLVRFCLKHQLMRENGWDCELSEEERNGLIEEK